MYWVRCVTDFQPNFLPSREQIVAAIYETVLRSQLFDRFSAAQQSDSFAVEKPMSGGPNPVFEAPELQAHFARALEILEQQWVQMSRPNPVKVWKNPAVPGWEDNTVREDDIWILVTLEGELLQTPEPQAREPDLRESAKQELLCWVTRAQHVDGTWQGFVDRIGSQDFSWQDILVLETPVRNKTLLCRPVWVGAEGAEGGAGGGPVAISVELVDVCWPGSANSFIAETFGLNAREVHNLRSLALGQEQDLAQVEDRARIAAKAGAPGPADLVRLVGFLLQEYASDMAIARGERLPESLEFRDSLGRVTQCFRLGAETGQPVIFVHGMLDGIAGVQQMQPLLRTGGFRVYAPLRGGYGGSHPPPEKHQQLDAFVAQIEALIDQENLRRPLLLGHRSGVIFARAAALRLRGRVGGLLGVAPAPPLPQARDYRRNHRALALCARFVPPLVPLVLKGWSRSVQQQGASVLVRNQARAGSKGWEQIRGKKLESLLSLSLSMIMEQGGAGLLADLKLVPDDWRDQMIGHAEQTVYLCGAEEALVRQNGLYPQVLGAEKIQLRVCSGAGDVLLYVCPELVLAALEDLSSVPNPEFSQVG
ncbi:MAG: pimeloyl-ACP methyl ester carboxylesterase [Pseudophaeobacter arcticus]